MGRRRTVPHGPRNIDLDLLLVDSMVGDWPGLALPHAHLLARAFVLRPLLELNPDLVDPRTLRRLSENLAQVADQQICALGPLASLAAAEGTGRAAAGRG
jgi:2-amino-4-hydroxy-6-hydroxymethyldihydropteridine diphosphokinase